MNFHILTLFPDMIRQGLSTSIIGRAAEQRFLSIEAINIRDYTLDKHNKVDDTPYGGGAGMLMQAQPVYDAWRSVAGRTAHKPRTVYLTPQGTTFNQALARELAKEEELILLCGHYEGIDERVLEEIVTDYISIGDYVLTGGELPAMVMVDAISRMVPGVLGNELSGETESFEGELLEYPQYSRPKEWMGKQVPTVLLSGNQKEIRDWRRKEAIKRTKERRPDLYHKYEALENCRNILQKQKLLHVDMTELIVRGQAEILYAVGENICLRDKNSGIYFHTAQNLSGGREALLVLKEILMQESAVKQFGSGRENLQDYETTNSCWTPKMLVLHQEFMTEAAEEILGVKMSAVCQQMVYTRREKLPVSGLYVTDGKKQEGQLEIKQLSAEELDAATELAQNAVHMDDMRERVQKGCVYGAVWDGILIGVIGKYAEGRMGMLYVLPKYRGKKIGKALETFFINHSLEEGDTPYCQIDEENQLALQMQASLGLYPAKNKIYRMA